MGIGIGEELSLLYGEQGAKLVLSARRVDKLRNVADKTKLAGANQVEVVSCDVSSRDDCKKLIDEAIARCGRIDVLILNAGVGQVN